MNNMSVQLGGKQKLSEKNATQVPPIVDKELPIVLVID